MTDDGAGSSPGNDAGTEQADPRRTTRRVLLAAAATGTLGLGVIGALRGTADGRRPPSNDAWAEAPSPGTGTARTAERSEPRADPPVIGANLNGRPHRLLDNLELIDASDTTVVRAFLDVRRKLARGGRPEDDLDVLALRQVALERDCKLVVSLKWDFAANWGDKEPMRVPKPGSAEEAALHRTASRYIEAIGAPVDVLVLGNEPMWETLSRDIQVEDPPIVRFTRDAKDHLVGHGDFGDPTYLVGAFNRSHEGSVREQHYPHFYRATSRMVRDDADVDGIDLHLHYRDIGSAEHMVAAARRAFPDGTITATEFCPVWRYDRHVHDPIAESETGATFARDYGLPGTTTAVEYFEHAKRNPRPTGELADFYDAMPWYNVDHVADVCDLLARYGVEVGTFGFLAGVGMRHEDWTADWTPFHINFLFQPALLRTDAGVEDTAHPHYIEDYRERTGRGR